ncbi:MAG: sulfatase-like hydrolase/transferase [Candidatus Pseudobacter hemicellulosilyticus]|uniref:Sulfatase-like hydrolase/transferase n=1 Tax=Candidatus Pseudobacter hemicellulosilyticus TaxID=3121375 RepID=A0AAJ6BJ13_9BACT|nr:MAG: sulfatase-like hydrolase/transferase [Pseudobacter sp.]
MTRYLLIILLMGAFVRSSGQEIGANFNHDPEIIDFSYLSKTPVEWIRTTPYIFEYIQGEKDPATEPGLDKVIEAKKRGYKVAFGFRWDFRKFKLRIPAPGSSEEKKYFAVAAAILDKVGPSLDMFKLGNEPNLETMEADLQYNAEGIVPLVRFTERLLTEVVEPYYTSHKELKRPDIYAGSLPRLFAKEEQQKPGVAGLIKLAQNDPRIKGFAIHLHIADSLQMEEAFRFIRSIMPEKPIIVPEFSLFQLYNRHTADLLGDSPAGKAFATKYGYQPSMKLYEWYSKANSQRVSATEWQDLFDSRTWFPKHFLLTYYRYFQKYGVVLATYGYLSQSAPARMDADSPTWFINPIFPFKSLQKQADGSHTPNPLWFDDFVTIVNKGRQAGKAVGRKQPKSSSVPPNIVIIYTDDLGYGDLSCYGATAVQTPNIDQLAAGGIRFTDAHCTAATCTPSRFSLLTGMYAFRNDAAILPGDAPLLIPTNIETLPGMLQKAGYKTGVVGKWHLGLGHGTIDWNKKISPGPNETGFNYSFIIPATVDRVPCVYLENQEVYQADASDPIYVSYKEKIGDEPTGLSHPQLLKMAADTQHSNTIINGISRIGYMTGGAKARWVDEDMPGVFLQKAKAFIDNNKQQPFFLYFALTNVHVPRTPHNNFLGKSPMGRRGDVILEMDWLTGQLMDELRRQGLDSNTIVIFSSDNGPVLDDGYVDQAVELAGNHRPGGIYRGGKYSAYEAGTRVPVIISWPGAIKPGISNTLHSQIDWMASFAALTGQKLAKGAGPDSRNALPVMLGQSNKDREFLLEEAFTLSLRSGQWKYVAPQEKGTPDWLANKDIETGLSTSPQLYDLKKDPEEKHNIAAQQPKTLKQLQKKLSNIRKQP